MNYAVTRRGWLPKWRLIEKKKNMLPQISHKRAGELLRSTCTYCSLNQCPKMQFCRILINSEKDPLFWSKFRGSPCLHINYYVCFPFFFCFSPRYYWCLSPPVFLFALFYLMSPIKRRFMNIAKRSFCISRGKRRHFGPPAPSFFYTRWTLNGE